MDFFSNIKFFSSLIPLCLLFFTPPAFAEPRPEVDSATFAEIQKLDPKLIRIFSKDDRTVVLVKSRDTAENDHVNLDEERPFFRHVLLGVAVVGTVAAIIKISNILRFNEAHGKAHLEQLKLEEKNSERETKERRFEIFRAKSRYEGLESTRRNCHETLLVANPEQAEKINQYLLDTDAKSDDLLKGYNDAVTEDNTLIGRSSERIKAIKFQKSKATAYGKFQGIIIAASGMPFLVRTFQDAYKNHYRVFYKVNDLLSISGTQIPFFKMKNADLILISAEFERRGFDSYTVNQLSVVD